MRIPARFVRGAFSVAVSLLMALLPAPVAALAQDAQQPDVPDWAVDDGGNWEDFFLDAQASIPAAYDLRSDGLVTPVKLQGPWGACWAFGGIAAAESSLLSITGSTYEQSKLDLSERHLAYFALSHIAEDSGSSQAGEGAYLMSDSLNAAFDSGGTFGLITTLFSQGVGPVTEELFPYRGRNAIFDASGKSPCYSKGDDWTIPEIGEGGGSNRLVSGGFVLANGNILPEYWSDGDRTDNTAGVNAIKQEILDGRAVCIGFYADKSKPSDTGEGEYLNNKTWAQYTYEYRQGNHAVCIVGWDDDYAASNFNVEHQPPANGAWIVKNSWGSEADACADDLGNVANKNNWGYVNEEGQHTGYFYLSYYDKTIETPESLEFSRGLVDYSQFEVMQYDYMPAFELMPLSKSADVMSTANVFTTDRAVDLKSVSTSTPEENMRVTFAIYLLDDDAKDPTDGTLVDRVSRNYEYAGYHRMDLERRVPLKKGQRFSVVSTASLVDEAGIRMYAASAGINFTEKGAVEKGLNKYYKAMVNEGESWLYNEGKWTDWSAAAKQISESHDQITLDNFSIKVYVVESENGSQEMSRLYNPNSGEHLYTASVAERDHLVGLGWAYEGVAWLAPAEGDPVYRLYNPNAGEHHYTTDTAERDRLVSLGWSDEGVGWCSDQDRGVPVLREYNPNELACNHNYTTDEAEHDRLVSLGWKDEGIAWYAVAVE